MSHAPQNTTEQANPFRATNGRFTPGRSGNPGGRPRIVADVQTLARAYTTLAIGTLSRIAGDKSAPAAARVAACNALSDRGWGKPVQGITVEADLELQANRLQEALCGVMARSVVTNKSPNVRLISVDPMDVSRSTRGTAA